MAMAKIIGREKEIKVLEACMNSGKSEFVMLYGRRRIGKTFLINSFFNDSFAFKFTGVRDIPRSEQLARFASELVRFAKLPFVPKFESWLDAFEALKSFIDSLPPESRKVIFFDEMPWIDTPNSSFLQALEGFWNGWADARTDVLLIACGSSTSWMVENLAESTGGLHNRITRRIYLAPFSLKETEECLQSIGCNWDRFQITQCYMILGGIPFYLGLLSGSLSLAQNIDDLVFSKTGILHSEFNELYSALFKNADRYIEVVRALSEKNEGLTRQELVGKVGMNGGGLTKILSNLEQSDFILSYNQFGSEKNGLIYRLSDFYTLFYLRFVENEHSRDPHYWSRIMHSPKVLAWQGYTFELIALIHTEKIKEKLGISGILTFSCSWRNKDNQIDLLIDRSDRMINVCEIKFSESKFIITKDYEQKLRERIALFKEATRTRKSTVMTFITTFGVMNNLHSSIVQNEVVLDDFFD